MFPSTLLIPGLLLLLQGGKKSRYNRGGMVREEAISSTRNQSWIVPAVQLLVTQMRWVCLLSDAWVYLSVAVPITLCLALLNCYVSEHCVSGPQGKSSDYSTIHHSCSQLQSENA